MASVMIRARTIGSAENGTVGRRFDVRVKIGRYHKTEHFGTFKTRKNATERAEAVSGWIAQGKNPRAELDKMLAPPSEDRRLTDVADEWLASLHDIADTTRSNYASMLPVFKEKWGKRAPETITWQDVTAWVAELTKTPYAAGTVELYVARLRQILDYADVEPNPARNRKVRLPRNVSTEIAPPDADDVLKVLKRMMPRHRRLVILLEQTGMRISEACALLAEDVDREQGRLIVRRELTKTQSPRWIELPDWLLETLPGDGRLFPGANRRTVYGAIVAAVDLAVVDHWHPHDLRHRRATLWHQQGVNAVELARRLGHARPSISLDVYSHVRSLREIETQELVRLAK